tara:strand:+ start:585 stop:1547 length:963 start_codon:yes stop_codon:yes gene_type:complete
MGKIVVKKIQSQASNTAFTIPSSDGSANQVIKTDGSANLSWTDKAASVASNSGISYNMPASDGTSGQALKTSDALGNTVFGNTPQMPLTTPDGNHQAYRLVDKYMFGNDSGTAGNPNTASSVTLTVPSSITTTPSDVLILWLRITGYSMNGTGQEYGRVAMKNQAGTTSLVGSGTNYWAHWYSHMYQGGNHLGSNSWSPGNTDIYAWGGSQHYGYSNSGEGRFRIPSTTNTNHNGVEMNFHYINNKQFPQTYQPDNYTNQGTSGNYYGKVGRSSAVPYNNDIMHNSTDNHSMGLSWSSGGQTFRDGVFELYAWFKDGVVG